MSVDLRFEVLGPVQVLRSGQPVRVTGRRQRLLLSVLLAEAPRVVSAARLVDALWLGNAEPQDPVNALHQYVAHLRRPLSEGIGTGNGSVLETSPPGYRLAPALGAVDAEDLAVLTGRLNDLQRSDDHVAAVQVAFQALALWRGTPFDEFADHPFLVSVVGAYAERRTALLERLVTSLAALGDHRRTIEALEGGLEWADRPHLASAYVSALAFADRQADALAAAEQHRVALAERGLEPSVAFRLLTDEIATRGRPRIDQADLVVVRSAAADSLRELLRHLPAREHLDLASDAAFDLEIAAVDAANEGVIASDTDLWLASLRKREPGVLSLLDRANPGERAETARMLRLAVSYARYWDWTGDQLRLRRELVRALDARIAAGEGDDRTVAEAAGWLAYSYGDDASRGEEYLELARRRTEHDPLGAGRALAVESVILRRDAPEAALDRGADAVRLLRHHGEPAEVAYAHLVSALAALDADLTHAAAWHIQEADHLYRLAGDRRGLAWVDVVQHRLEGDRPSFASRFSAQHDEHTIPAMLEGDPAE